MSRKLPNWLKVKQSVATISKLLITHFIQKLDKNSTSTENGNDTKSSKADNTYNNFGECKLYIMFIRMMDYLCVFSNSADARENVEPRPRYGLRSSQVKPDFQKEEDELFSDYADLPFIDYKGRVEYYTEFHAIAIACDTLS